MVMPMTTMSRKRLSRSSTIAALAGTGVVLAVAVGVLATRDGGTQTLTVQPAAAVSSLEHGCQQWLAQDPTPAGTSASCTAMGTWMAGHMTSSGMGPAMMWGGPDQLGSMCRQWTTDDPAATGPATGNDADWCASMATWMSTHMGSWTGRSDWGDWMAHGPMQGH